MLSVNQFNGLGGTTATRASLIELKNQAINDGNEEIVSRIDGLLSLYPKAEIFEDIQLDDYVIEPVPESFLHGLDYEQIEDEGEGLGRVSPAEVYDMITAKVIKMIADANLPGYKKKWKAGEYGTGYTIPFNFVTKKRYRGINVLMLTELEPIENPYFLTFKQVNDLKGKVKKGAKGYEVVYFTKIWKAEDKPKNLKFSSYDKAKVETFRTENSIENDLGVIPMLKYYHVYNGNDIEGIDFGLDKFKIGFIDIEKPSSEANKMDIPEAILKNYPKPQPILKFGGNRAFHQGGGVGLIQMPHIYDFETIQDYYRTLFHEYSHSTGSPQRLNRKLGNKFGSKDYAIEELVAELGAIFLSAEAGIIWHNNTNHAAYLKSWNSVLSQIKDDNKFIMRASTAAQKVADFVLQFDENGDPLYFKDLGKVVDKKPVAKNQTLKQKFFEFLKDDNNNNFVDEKNNISVAKNSPKFYKFTQWVNGHIADSKDLILTNPKSYQKIYNEYNSFILNSIKTLTPIEPKYKVGDSVSIDTFEAKVLSFKLNRKKEFVYKCKYVITSEIFEAVESDLHIYEKSEAKRVNKPASNYGKKTKRVAKPKTPEYPFSENDIPYETAYRAYTGISFSPEKRAVSEQKGYFEFLKSVYDENLVIATKNDKLEIFKSNFESFQKGYLKRSLDHLRSKHGIYSSMIAGASKFPVARMEKLNNIANNKLNELVDFAEKGQKRLLQNITPEVDKPIKTGASGTLKVLLEKLAEAEKIHQRNLEGNKFLKKIRANKEATLQDYIDGFVKIGFDPETAKKEANYVLTYSYAGFFTTNSNAKVKRIKEQIALEEKLKAKAETTGNIEYKFDDGTVLLNYDDNKIQIFYNEKPSEEERTKLKKSGNAFKWSPFNKAWQRQLNTYPLRYLKELLPSIDLESRKTDKEPVSKVQKKTKIELEEINPKPFAIKPKSIAVTAAIKAVLTLPKYKGINVQQAHILYNTFKNEDWEDYPGFYLEKEIKPGYEISIMKNETNFHSYFDEKVTIWGLGFDLVQTIKKRLESLQNQKNNYALFDGLAGTKSKKKGLQSPDVYEELNFEGVEKIYPNNYPIIPITGQPDFQNIEAQVEEKISQPAPDQSQPSIVKNKGVNRNSLAYRRQNRSNTTHEYYEIENPDIADFLGKIEKKKKESVAITIAGGQGSGKTSFVFQLINEFAKKYKVGHASIEEHPESALYEDKAERFWNENAKQTVDSPEINTMEDIDKLILRNDVIIIDSFSKLLSMDRKISLDETFRKKYDGKLFIIIYQLTTTGSMRGGSASQFDGDIILFVEKFPNFNDNYVYADKNRYQTKAMDELHYNIAASKLIEAEEIEFEEIEKI